MSGRWRGLFGRVFGSGLPQGFPGTLDTEENVVAVAQSPQGHLVATQLGLWLPEEDGVRRIGWHLISKATWGSGALSIIEAAPDDEVAGAVVLADLPPRRFVLTQPGRLPEAVHARVTGSIRGRHHEELPGGGAWFVRRKVPGRDGLTVQVRPEPGTDRARLDEIVAEVVGRMHAEHPES